MTLVPTEHDRARPVGAWFDHGERRYPLGMAVGRRQTSISQKAMAVLLSAHSSGFPSGGSIAPPRSR